MSNWCLYPNQCGPGMDCSKCYENRVKQLQSDNERLHDVCAELQYEVARLSGENGRLKNRVSELEGVLNDFVTEYCDREGAEDLPIDIERQDRPVVREAMQALGESNES